MITLDELSNAVYEDLNGHIIEVSTRDDAVHLLFECDDWTNTASTRATGRRRFDLRFHEVAECTATPSATGIIQVADEHPLLWNHNDEHVSMFFSSSPANPFELFGQLCVAHGQLFKGWRPVGDYLHAGPRLMHDGYGLFAQGPRRAVEEYQRIVEGKLRYSIIHGYRPHGGYKAVLFDTCYVICRSDSATEIEPDTA